MGKGMGCGASKGASVDVPTADRKLSRGTSAVLKAELIVHLTQTVGIPAEDSAVQDYADALHRAGYSTVAAFAELTVEQLCETPYSFKPYHATLVGRYRKQLSETTDDATDGSGNEVRAAESPASGSATPRASGPADKEQGGAQAPYRWAPRVLPESGVGASEIWMEMDTESGHLRLEGPSLVKDKDGNLSGAQISGNQLIMDTLGDEHINFVLGALCTCVIARPRDLSCCCC
jgi:hypothetical protein